MADVKTQKQKAKEITDKLEEGLKELMEGWSGTKDRKDMESSLNTIHRTALELLTGMENQLREMQHGGEQMQEQGKESILLIQYHDLSDYSLIRVEGMDAAELAEALSCMNDDDRQSISKYLKNKGMWTEEIASEAIGNAGECCPDVWYSTDTNEVIDLTAETGQNEKAEETAEKSSDEEADLLNSSSDKYGIYQLKNYPELEQFRFKGTETLKRMSITDSLAAVKPDHYNLIYTGGLSELQKPSQEAVLEALYEKFNTDRPKDFQGHSLSVSDIVVLHKNGKNSVHFVDSFGFTELPDFIQELEGIKEQSVPQDIPEQNNQKQEAEPEPPEIEQLKIKQTESEQTQIKQAETEWAEPQTGQKQGRLELAAEILEFEDIDDEDEIIDLGDEREQVLAEMKKSLDRLRGNSETEERIEPQRNAAADFKAKTNELFHEISGMNPSEIEKTVKYHVQARLEEYGVSAEMIDVAITGSRCRGLEREGSDLDVAVELSTNEREDVLFDILNENRLYIGGVKVDINPITAQKTGSLETYLPQAEDYLKRLRETREKEQVSIFNAHKGLSENLYQKQSEMEVTLTVAECGGFHNPGKVYRNIPAVDEAIALWKQIPPERMNGIPAVAIHIHTPGTEAVEDVEFDILSGNKIHLDALDDIPDIKSSPQVMEVMIELIAKLPEIEIDGSMSEAMETAVWRKRMPGLTPVERLAVEINRFACHYDTATYHENTQNMMEHVAELMESISQGDVSYLIAWLADVIAEETEPEERKRAEKLLEKLAEYNVPAKLSKIKEQNYYMEAHVSDNGAEEKEKAQKKENRKEQGFSVARASLKAQLAEKKRLVSGQGKATQSSSRILTEL